jgi:uncharacterized protein
MTGMKCKSQSIDSLCLGCGICCNGVLFKDVKLLSGDDPAKLRALEMLPRAGRANRKFPQPCAALQADGLCRVYPDRPSRCSDFECALLKAVDAGKTGIPAALRTIRTALRQADQVKDLLRRLGDTEETMALSLRFRAMQKAMHSRGFDEDTAALYGELTLAVHDLNMLLRREFYP